VSMETNEITQRAMNRVFAGKHVTEGNSMTGQNLVIEERRLGSRCFVQDISFLTPSSTN
jgi:hypothetical protein